MLDKTKTGTAIIPCLTYRDAPAAIEFLCRAFGFETKMVVDGGPGIVAHAELVLGNAMIMVSTAKGSEFGRLLQPPKELGMATQSIYFIVDDADAHHARAAAAGAEVVLPLKTQDYGGRDYTCRDTEGHVWSFGTYDPWK